MRIVPASVLDFNLSDHLLWPPKQLASEELRDPPDNNVLPHTPNNNTATGEQGTQYHRNFFVILFDRTGIVNSRSAVFIVDSDAGIVDYPSSSDLLPDACGFGVPYPGFRTRLIVSDDSHPVVGLRNAVVDFDCERPLHFQSADSVLIYNDESFRALPSTDSPDYNDNHRRVVRRSSAPLSRPAATGRIIKGRAEGA